MSTSNESPLASMKAVSMGEMVVSSRLKALFWCLGALICDYTS